METWIAAARQMPLTYSHKQPDDQEVQEAHVLIVVFRTNINCDTSHSLKTGQVYQEKQVKLHLYCTAM